MEPHQGEFAKKIGVRQSQLSSWESGAIGIKIEHLAVLADAGVDILYVITGRRGGALLPEAESKLLDACRSLQPLARDALLTVAQCMGENIHAPANPAAPVESAMHQPRRDYRSG